MALVLINPEGRIETLVVSDLTPTPIDLDNVPLADKLLRHRLPGMKTVTFLSKLWMGRIDKPVAIISIGDPKESLPDLACDPIDLLRIEVDDVEEDLGPEYLMFDWHHARKILEFEHRYKDHDIVVHCFAGVSRSPAVALFLADHTGRILDLCKPCGGDYSRHNKWIYRQMQITRIDLLNSGAKITRKGAEL